MRERERERAFLSRQLLVARGAQRRRSASSTGGRDLDGAQQSQDRSRRAIESSAQASSGVRAGGWPRGTAMWPAQCSGALDSTKCARSGAHCAPVCEYSHAQVGGAVAARMMNVIDLINGQHDDSAKALIRSARAPQPRFGDRCGTPVTFRTGVQRRAPPVFAV